MKANSMETSQQAITLAELEEQTTQHFYFNALHLRVNDTEKNRWTDCWVSARVKNGRVVFTLNHERGYPSQEKGSTYKTITASWLSENIPNFSKCHNAGVHLANKVNDGQTNYYICNTCEQACELN